ncbi:MAG: TRAP transporter substrate-binding protein [Clostridiales bacterium]|nr:TRAP transporter substrate-binding protein [Clostridiales bacterium]
MEKKTRKLVAVILVGLMILSLAACGLKSPDQTNKENQPTNNSNEGAAIEGVADSEHVTLVYAEVNPQDSLMGKTAAEFKKKVEELSAGTITVDVQYGGVLGAEGDVLDTMIGGIDTIDMARISVFSLNPYGTKLSSLLSVPYMIDNRDHFWAIAASDYGQQVLNEPVELGLGVRGLFFVEEGFRHLFFNAEVKSIDDIKGKKIRVSTDPIMMGMISNLGGSPTSISFNELYSSLSTGVVEGAEQPIANYQSNAFNEVAPYMILDGHTMGACEVIITETAWNKLSEPQKQAVMEAGQAASEFNANLSEANENDCIAELEAEGVTFVDVPDLQPWRDACADTIKKATDGMEDYVKLIQELAK